MTSGRDREAFRPHVAAALKGMADHDEQTQKDKKGAEERMLASYPFHPDLTDILHNKWANLEGFQRTRGVLRTFALALRDQWQPLSPVDGGCFATVLATVQFAGWPHDGRRGSHRSAAHGQRRSRVPLAGFWRVRRRGWAVASQCFGLRGRLPGRGGHVGAIGVDFRGPSWLQCGGKTLGRAARRLL